VVLPFYFCLLNLKIHIQPGARKNEIVGLHGDAIKIKIKAPPVDGRANEELIDFLAKHYGVPKRSVQIVSGHTSRQKTVKIE